MKQPWLIFLTVPYLLLLADALRRMARDLRPRERRQQCRKFIREAERNIGSHHGYLVTLYCLLFSGLASTGLMWLLWGQPPIAQGQQINWAQALCWGGLILMLCPLHLLLVGWRAWQLDSWIDKIEQQWDAVERGDTQRPDNLTWRLLGWMEARGLLIYDDQASHSKPEL